MKFSANLLGKTLLAAALALAITGCSGQVNEVVQPENAEQVNSEDEAEEKPDEVQEQSYDYKTMTQEELLALYPDPEVSGTVTIGTSTVPNSDMFYGWTNINPNARIKYLLFRDYSLVTTDPSEEFFINNVVVEDWDSTDNDDGSKTFTFKIHENLVNNDGSPISAKDYLFTQMLMSSPEFTAIDGSATYGIKFVGYSDFYNGETKTFSGLRLLDDYSFSITVDPEELPYYYDKAFFIDCYPVPMHVLAPGVELTDDGSGATLSEEFTADLLRQTMADDQNGYRYKPTVTPGVYQLESYDDTTFTAVLNVNPNFLCLADGQKPSIERIVVKNTTQSTEMNELEIGQIDLLPQITTGTQIDFGLEMVDNGLLGYDSYARHGYGYIGMHCDFGPTQFEAVRQALCYLLDREEFGRQYSGGYAIVVDARYSESQWTYQELKDELADKLINYTLNTDRANELLDADGWVLDADGNDYVAGSGNIRHKMVDGELMPLVIEWCSSVDNSVTDLLAVMLPPAAEQVGMKINQTLQDSVLDTFYRTNVDEPFFHIFNMGVTFGTPDAPWNSYSTKPQFWGPPYNQNYIANDVLEAATNRMKLTDPEDREGFLEAWEAYVIEWNKTLPDIPLYANIYHDFYQLRLQNYSATPTWNWDRSIPRCTLSD